MELKKEILYSIGIGLVLSFLMITTHYCTWSCGTSILIPLIISPIFMLFIFIGFKLYKLKNKKIFWYSLIVLLLLLIIFTPFGIEFYDNDKTYYEENFDNDYWEVCKGFNINYMIKPYKPLFIIETSCYKAIEDDGILIKIDEV